MNPFLERTYFSLPVWLQNAAISAYGLSLERQRYSRESDAFLKRLHETERLSEEEMAQYVRCAMQDMIHHALATVPYWKDWAGENDAEPEDFRSLEDLRRLPTLRKSDIVAAPEQFVSEGIPRRGRIRLSTSGTTGTPLEVLSNHSARTHHYAFFRRLREWYGVGRRALRATFFGRAIMHPEADSPPFWRYDAAQNNMLFSSYHLSRQNIRHYVNRLRELRPVEIIGYPSSLVQLAAYILENDQKPLTPRVVITTAETLLQHQRELLEDAFLCPVVNQYGCTEMAFFAAECEEGTMHVHPEHGWIECLDSSGSPAGPGESGRCVATGFVNAVMPLLRYEIGDQVSLGVRKCPCGRPFPVLERIEGRADDMIQLPDGRVVGRLDPVFKGLSGITECQIAQVAPLVLELRVVANSAFDVGQQQALVSEVRTRTGNQLEVHVRRIREIPKGQNGKFRAVVREFS